MATTKPAPLDERRFYNHKFVEDWGVHSNTILPYFAQSEFSNPQSNNAVLLAQSHYNANISAVVSTRETFEERLRSMHGLEYIVAQEPEQTGWKEGTGVWVIREQERLRGADGKGDTVRVIADYFVCGDCIFKAPTFADIMSSRLATMSNSIGKIFEGANRLQQWTPATGHVYKTPKVPRAQTLEPKEATPMPESSGGGKSAGLPSQKSSSKAEIDARLAEQSFTIHGLYGGDYMDENPITGKPGDFHFASTGRSDKDRLAPPQAPSKTATPAGLPSLNTKAAAETSSAKTDKEKSPNGLPPKPKRRKSTKGGKNVATATSTPTPS